MNSMRRPAFAGVTQPEHDIAVAALREITSEDSIGEAIGRTENEDGTLNLIFACLLPGYPGWQWNVSIGRVDGDAPTAIEADLLPTEDALVAPEWVPWSLRLADFLEAQRAAAEAGIELEGAPADLVIVSDDDDDDDEDDDDDDDDEDDDDDDDEDDDDHELDLEIEGVDFEGADFESESAGDDDSDLDDDANDNDDADDDEEEGSAAVGASDAVGVVDVDDEDVDADAVNVDEVDEVDEVDVVGADADQGDADAGDLVAPKKAPRRRFRFLRG